MITNKGRDYPSARIHAIVLTRNRPETLQRCLTTALSTLTSEDALTVLDDSDLTTVALNRTLLTKASLSASPRCFHLPMLRTQEVIGQSTSRLHLDWLAKTAPRDIAPLRNLSLLLSTIIPATTTIFVDDDIHEFNVTTTHSRMSAFAQFSTGVIGCATIAGVNENDSITKLHSAAEALSQGPHTTPIGITRNLFLTPPCSCPMAGTALRYGSAGYLAFRLPPERLFAFPPGYNEDWLWCLLHSGHLNVKILHLGEKVIHDPPVVRMPTRDDFLFELLGDVVLDCLDERCGRIDSDPEVAITALSKHIPNRDSMPSARAVDLLDRVKSSRYNEVALAMLNRYGLELLRDMLASGELNIDARHILPGWCAEAAAKQRALSTTLWDSSASSALTFLLREGQLE